MSAPRSTTAWSASIVRSAAAHLHRFQGHHARFLADRSVDAPECASGLLARRSEYRWPSAASIRFSSNRRSRPCAVPLACGTRKSISPSVSASPVFWLKVIPSVRRWMGFCISRGGAWSSSFWPSRVALQVDVDLALGNYRSRLLVVLKVIAVDLVKAVRFPPVNNDVHIVQLGPAARFELRRLGGVNREQRASAFALGKRKILRWSAECRSRVFLEDSSARCASQSAREDRSPPPPPQRPGPSRQTRFAGEGLRQALLNQCTRAARPRTIPQ